MHRVLPALLQAMGVVDAVTAMSVVQPILAVVAAGMTKLLLGGARDRLRHKVDTSLMIGSVLAVWFVAYFASGMIVTYVHNAVAMSWQAILINILTYGVAAAAIEYVRYGIMMVGGRRNIVWLGVVVSLVVGIQQLSLVHLADVHGGIDIIKLAISDVLPVVVTSLLLTYLAVTAGLGPQLTFRLGVVAAIYLPPIIPKYDWYLAGMAWLMLAVAVYVVLDRNRDGVASKRRPRGRHPRRAADIMFLIMTVMLVLFMTGAFSYRPRVIMSNSMHPVFSRGSMVIVQNATAVDVHEGDIIQYEAHGRSVTHRVISIDTAADGSGRRIFITKGDNSPSVDMPVQAQQIAGIIRAQVPYVGYPTVWLNETVK
ncbi:signal peptidase I [Patescibacteria group bacterium]|nr:MAG: signal peptidase I [Patescibacteria group bacterium]